VITLASADDVYAVLPDRYQLRCEVPAGRPPRFAAAGTRAVAFASPVLTDWVMAFGEPGEAAALLVSVIAAMPVPPRGFTLPRDAHRLLPPDPAIRWLDHWDFMWTASPPPRLPAEDRVDWLGEADHDAIDALLDTANPSRTKSPRDGWARRWAGLRDGSGALVAVGAVGATRGGQPHLASIGTRPDTRGQGLGAAVTAFLTRPALASDGVCTLRMYADNAVARRLYHRLGYRTDGELTSGGFVVPG